ncbi:unnamed protein product [Bemisia tabaci]|uniref:Uncharacterized protein n=1 Tax=Bemisia tabaci TaxID=7038 RepID=A0A9P0G4Y7_BEMTA|nr:unnamed protein product [Bemisia tabaci]
MRFYEQNGFFYSFITLFSLNLRDADTQSADCRQKPMNNLRIFTADAYVEALATFDQTERSVRTLVNAVKSMFDSYDLRRLDEYLCLMLTFPAQRQDFFINTQLNMRFDYNKSGHIDIFIHRNDGTVFAINFYNQQVGVYLAMHRAIMALNLIKNQRGQKGGRDRVKSDFKHEVAAAMRYAKTDICFKLKPGVNITLSGSFIYDDFHFEDLFGNAVNITV